MSDTALLGLFLTRRDVFDKHASTMPTHLLEPETLTLLQDMTAWYSSHHQPIVPNDIAAFWEYVKLVCHPTMSSTKLDAMKELIRNAIKAAKGADAATLLKSLVLRDHAGRIAEKADRYSAGDTSFNLFSEVLDDVEVALQEAGLHNSHSNEVTFDVSRVLDNLMTLSSGLSWRSPSLQAALGPLRKGNFVMLAGFVDSGKSTLLASEVTYMAAQLPPDEKVLYFNFEEAGDRVMARLWQSSLGWSLDYCNNHRKELEQRYIHDMGGDKDKIILLDSGLGPITPGLIRKKLREYKVGLMVFDQLYKLRGFKRNGDDKLGQLQDIYEYGRTLAKQHAPVIAIHQARGDANGLQRIEMHQLAQSQQAVQGELDAIVTIGNDITQPNMRYLYVPKNKMPSPGDPLKRKGFFPVNVDFDCGRFDT